MFAPGKKVEYTLLSPLNAAFESLALFSSILSSSAICDNGLISFGT